MAPRRPRPTVNIPATPPARNAMRSAARRPLSRAAFAVRTFARTASHMPAYPVIAENAAPRMNAIERPSLIDVAECWAFSGAGRRKNSATVRMPRKIPTVRNCRDRYALAPSWIAVAISRIFEVPSGADSTSRTRYHANSRATNEIPRIDPERGRLLRAEDRFDRTLLGDDAHHRTSWTWKGSSPPGLNPGREPEKDTGPGPASPRPGSDQPPGLPRSRNRTCPSTPGDHRRDEDRDHRGIQERRVAPRTPARR